MNSSKILLAGLPSSGKTTFLAALWHVINSHEVPDALKLEILDGDREYLNDIARLWRTFKPIPRTRIAEEQRVTFKLRDSHAERIIELALPDMSGESFEQFLEQREWPVTFDQFVREASGFLVFINPDKIRPGVVIADAEPAFLELGQGSDAETGVPTPWEFRFTPTEVLVVDLLQLLLLPREGPSRVGIVISAWDLVASEAIPPGDWLAKRLPLLWQYLQNVTAEVIIYGVSAQGGDLENDRTALRTTSTASERIQVVVGDLASHDLTQPLRWLLSTDA